MPFGALKHTFLFYHFFPLFSVGKRLMPFGALKLEVTSTVYSRSPGRKETNALREGWTSHDWLRFGRKKA